MNANDEIWDEDADAADAPRAGRRDHVCADCGAVGPWALDLGERLCRDCGFDDVEDSSRALAREDFGADMGIWHPEED